MTTSVNRFFGDKDHVFRLTPKLIGELERLTGCGFGALVTRIMERKFYAVDVFETIRLGLIGGGTDPQEAARLMRIYADDVPLAQVLPLAIEIVNATWFGAEEDQPEVEDANV